MWKQEQSYRGNQEQLSIYLIENHEELEDGSIIAVGRSTSARDQNDRLNLDVILLPPGRQLSDEELKNEHIPPHVEGYTKYGPSQSLGRIEIKPVGQQAVWLCLTSNEACIRFARHLAEKLVRLDLGIPPLEDPRYGQITAADILSNEHRFGEEIFQLPLDEQVLLLLHEHARLAHLLFSYDAAGYAEERLYEMGYALGLSKRRDVLLILDGQGFVESDGQRAQITSLGRVTALEIARSLEKGTFKQNEPPYTTPSGLLGPAKDIAQWYVRNATGETKSPETQEILKDPDRTAEYVERMVRVERGNAIGDTPVPKQPKHTVPTTLTLPQAGKLGKLISKWFSKDELRYLSLYLSLDYENFPSDTKDNMARELVLQANRKSEVSKLWTRLHEERPHVDWSQALLE